MFCLRSWLPLLFIPTNASPAFIFLFFACTYFLNKPCNYCTFLLLVLFLTSCNWSDRCFFDFSANWFQPRPSTTSSSSSSSSSSPSTANSTTGSGVDYSGGLDDATAAVAAEIFNSSATALASAAADQIVRARAEWTGLGMEWLRSLLGRREWRVDCLDIYIRL